jgi:hypothetical protein
MQKEAEAEPRVTIAQSSVFARESSMLGRFCVRALLLASIAVPFIGCGSSTEVDSIVVTPSTETWTLCGPDATGAPVQFTATGTYNHGAHPATTKDLTNIATWASNTPAIATVNSAGLVQVTPSSNGISGDTIITATMQGFGGPVTGTATLTKTISTSCTSVEPAIPHESPEK